MIPPTTTPTVGASSRDSGLQAPPQLLLVSLSQTGVHSALLGAPGSTCRPWAGRLVCRAGPQGTGRAEQSCVAQCVSLSSPPHSP